MIKLNLGCGSVRPFGWVNTDSSLNAHIQRIPFIGKVMSKLLGKVAYDSNNLVYMNLNKKWSFAQELALSENLFKYWVGVSPNFF